MNIEEHLIAFDESTWMNMKFLKKVIKRNLIFIQVCLSKNILSVIQYLFGIHFRKDLHYFIFNLS